MAPQLALEDKPLALEDGVADESPPPAKARPNRWTRPQRMALPAADTASASSSAFPAGASAVDEESQHQLDREELRALRKQEKKEKKARKKARDSEDQKRSSINTAPWRRRSGSRRRSRSRR